VIVALRPGAAIVVRHDSVVSRGWWVAALLRCDRRSVTLMASDPLATRGASFCIRAVTEARV